MSAYYNDSDPNVCAWLRELIKAGLITKGVVDERPIQEIRPEDLAGFTRVHLFAGIAGWDYALQLAGWPSDVPVWTGSCPCQPFSCAGKQRGFSDERHLWPVMRELIAKCSPAIVFGEQVDKKIGREWLARVRSEVETLGYAFGAADLCAASVGAGHIRQRLYWVAHTSSAGLEVRGEQSARKECATTERSCNAFRLEHSDAERCSRERVHVGPGRKGEASVETSGTGESIRGGRKSFWDGYSTIPCLDGKTRRFEPGSLPLANGVPARVVRLRGYGNAIVPQLAAEFIQASVEALNDY